MAGADQRRVADASLSGHRRCRRVRDPGALVGPEHVERGLHGLMGERAVPPYVGHVHAPVAARRRGGCAEHACARHRECGAPVSGLEVEDHADQARLLVHEDEHELSPACARAGSRNGSVAAPENTDSTLAGCQTPSSRRT